eukprot:6188191-Pleurochrysis_carterae.AAC.2
MPKRISAASYLYPPNFVSSASPLACYEYAFSTAGCAVSCWPGHRRRDDSTDKCTRGLSQRRSVAYARQRAHSVGAAPL